jgi:DHA3 family tetracycline resistance protein-like MFS transporter
LLQKAEKDFSLYGTIPLPSPSFPFLPPSFPFMRKLPAYPTYLLLSGVSVLFFCIITTVNQVYLVTVVHLNPLQLVLVGTMLETTCFLCEVPTGVVADVYSRRLSVIIGLFLVGVGFMVEGSLPYFSAVLISQVIWGTGSTFISGALDAWIADEVGASNAGRAFLRGAQVSQVGALVGIVVSVSLASVRVNLPILIGGALYIALAVFAWLVMSEHGFTPTPREKRNSFQMMRHTLRSGIQLTRQQPVLITILSVAVISGMFSEGFDRLWTPHVLQNFTLPTLGNLKPVVWFGIMNAVPMLLAIIVTEVAQRRLDVNSHLVAARALFVLSTLLTVSVIAFGLAGHFVLAFAAYSAIYVIRRTKEPIYAAWLNQRLDSQVRATMFSASSQMDALGQIIGGPILGVIATAVSLRAAIVIAGIVLSPALLLYARTMRRSE